MKIKCINNRVVIFISSLVFGSLSLANATELTNSTGIIQGTAPVIYNGNNEAGRMDFHRSNIAVNEDDELDISDAIELSWKINDAEGDQEATLPTVEWICTDASNNKRVLATGENKYVIHPGDKGCTLGINIIPATLTGTPRENSLISIGDISAYNDDDNIPSGPVNPHALNIVSYTVGPLNKKAAYTVPAEDKINTAFAGAQIQIETDNVATQLEWETSNPDIATVSDSGLVTIKAKGTFTIVAKHKEVKTSITFNPQKFFIFSPSTSMVWGDAKNWCEAQGYRMPTIDDLSSGEGKREVPSDSLWQEWGSSLDNVPHSGLVFWSSSEAIADLDAYYYMYTASGRATSNYSDRREGVACITP